MFDPSDAEREKQFETLRETGRWAYAHMQFSALIEQRLACAGIAERHYADHLNFMTLAIGPSSDVLLTFGIGDANHRHITAALYSRWDAATRQLATSARSTASLHGVLCELADLWAEVDRVMYLDLPETKSLHHDSWLREASSELTHSYWPRSRQLDGNDFNALTALASMLVELFKIAPGPGTFPADDLTREFGNSTDFLVVCQGRLPDVGLTVWVSFGAQRLDGSDRRVVGDLRAPWDGQCIDPTCVLLLDGETVNWSTFATVFWSYLDLPPMIGPATRQHEEIARLDRETAEILRATGQRLLRAMQLS